MTSKRSLIKLSASLLVFNLILGSYAVFTFLKANEKEDQNNIQNNTVLGASSAPIFNKNRIISDGDFLSTRAFPDEASVQQYLDQVNSPLRNYTDQGRRASYWIFAAARGQTSSKWGIVPQLNPGMILAYLQKEQSLLTMSGYDTVNDPEFRIRAAMGYGCPDDDSCNPAYKGFANQVNWAAYQLQLNFTQANTGGGTPYQINKTITTLDEYNVFITNSATAANYRYTPHVYWGNYNLWKIMTANGWGENSQTYSMLAIDELNLPLKNQPAVIPANETIISPTEAYPLLIKEYSLGQNNNEIRILQTFLRQQGYFMTNDITGTYGVITHNALITYRLDKGIIVNKPTDSCSILINKDYQFGQTSDEIVNLQQCLRDIGLFNFPSNTGYYGTITQSAHTKAKTALSSPVTPPITEVSTLSCEDLKNIDWQMGETSDRVKALQDCMTNLGFFKYIYGSTGYFGPITQQALDNWKKATTPTTPTTPINSIGNIGNSCSDMKKRSWEVGTTSNDVKILQDCMATDGIFQWQYGSTGYFGEVTKQAFIDWRAQGSTCQDLKQAGWIFGEQNNQVVKLQDCMATDGIFQWQYGSTGYFGEVTKQALIAWRGYF